MQENVVEGHVRFGGRVQGVGFRAMAKHYAQQMGVTGTVRNHGDGTVDLYVQGSKEQIDQYVKRLSDYFHLKPEDAKTVYENNPRKLFKDFQIL
jgi:acylphosphatase